MTKSKNKRILIILGAALIISFLLHGGYKNMTGSHKANMNKRPATVQLVNVIEKEIYDTLISTGRIEAKYSVDVVARVQGWIKKSYFID